MCAAADTGIEPQMSERPRMELVEEIAHNPPVRETHALGLTVVNTIPVRKCYYVL